MENAELTGFARAMECLGHETRLQVFMTLVRSGPGGLPVGEVQKKVDVPASTLSHHLSQLVLCNLVQQERRGRVLQCTANFATMNGLVEFLREECCQDASCC